MNANERMTLDAILTVVQETLEEEFDWVELGVDDGCPVLDVRTSCGRLMELHSEGEGRVERDLTLYLRDALLDIEDVRYDCASEYFGDRVGLELDPGEALALYEWIENRLEPDGSQSFAIRDDFSEYLYERMYGEPARLRLKFVPDEDLLELYAAKGSGCDLEHVTDDPLPETMIDLMSLGLAKAGEKEAAE
jgi:hypothetical protein